MSLTWTHRRSGGCARRARLFWGRRTPRSWRSITRRTIRSSVGRVTRTICRGRRAVRAAVARRRSRPVSRRRVWAATSRVPSASRRTSAASRGSNRRRGACPARDIFQCSAGLTRSALVWGRSQGASKTSRFSFKSYRAARIGTRLMSGTNRFKYRNCCREARASRATRMTASCRSGTS